MPTFPANEVVEVLVLRQEKPQAPAAEQPELEQAYRDACAEIDGAWEITVGDGLSDEAW